MSRVHTKLLCIILSLLATGVAGAEHLDLREANVTAVDYQSLGGGDYNFDVTLYHDDDDEDGYADLWIVEDLDGSELGRRELLHAHGTQEFTRSAVIHIPAENTLVVIRGHDQTHGWGGQVFIIEIATTRYNIIDQGSEPSDFSSYTLKTTSDDNRSEHSTTSEAGTSVWFIVVPMCVVILSRKMSKYH